MKKIICFAVAVVCALSMMACGGNAADTTTAAPETTVEETTLASAPYKAGTYTASAKGFGGDVTVSITFDETGAITEVVVEGASETPALGGVAMEKLAAKIKDTQSAEVDVMSGASFTSNAVIQAAQDCLAQAAN